MFENTLEERQRSDENDPEAEGAPGKVEKQGRRQERESNDIPGMADIIYRSLPPFGEVKVKRF